MATLMQDTTHRHRAMSSRVTMSRLAGLHECQPTLGSFLNLFARLRRADHPSVKE
jgi:hypothetical protein